MLQESCLATGCRKEAVCRTCPLARLHSSSARQLAVVDQKPDQSLIRNATEWQRLKWPWSLHQIGKATRDLALGDCRKSKCGTRRSSPARCGQGRKAGRKGQLGAAALCAPSQSFRLTPPLNKSLITNFGRLRKFLLIGADRNTTQDIRKIRMNLDMKC